MPYDKNKQQAFQAAQQAFVQLQDAMNDLHSGDVDYGHHHKRAEQELNEAIQVIQKAHITASEHQKQQLKQYETELKQFEQQLME
ncbi:hypothetical protein [Alteribacter aurantiacus]|uniref:hypothetical protein n=1 Tax=Alteribacter aurantiacus TaxID=254410 RepID=UPI000412FC51|nr:hypothetical protein [Alteribacter aurantiacus]